ncbi:MAG: sigma-54-dependent Fis family transcriptional regulator [Planctomycetota bacterium]|nr:MAG: sigma-54-dependent Fis family transcriptional regulator [Planctomycetota bacterium]
MNADPSLELPAMTDLLDLLEAITEIRVRNPELRQSVLSSLRLCMSLGGLASGRLYCLRFDGSITAIIAHGDASIADEEERRLVQQATESRQVYQREQFWVLPLGHERRCYGVLVLEGAEAETAQLLANLFFQWSAVAEFMNLEKAELIDENFQLREEIKTQFSERNIVGVSGSFRRVVESARKVAASSATVLIHGETGTGKELIARLIHDHSPRANAPFVTVNCGALSESLLETELFGHVKGAFTGAIADHKGRFEAAHGGTIFLDEIGEISHGMQVRLLRVLQEMEIVRVGDHRSRKLDVRVVAATNRDLEVMVREGTFRADLFYRLNVIYLSLPGIRSRKEDIPPLVEHFLGIYCARNCKFIDSVDRDVLEIMMNYPWPGNVRELENCIEKMVVMATGSTLSVDLLPMAIMAYSQIDHGTQSVPDPNNTPISESPSPMDPDALLAEMMRNEIEVLEADEGTLYEHIRRKWERHLFEAVLSRFRNNKTKAAKALGISRNTLNSRLDELSDMKREWKV